MNFLEIEKLSISFGGVKAVDDVSFAVEEGSVSVSYTHLTLPTICSV